MAGFFGLFNYSKPGPGVSKDQIEKKRFFVFFEIFFRKFWSLVSLNVVYLLCCIPIVTIGPMTAGLTYVLRNFSTETPGFPMSDMFERAWKNKGQAFAYGILRVVVLAASLFAFWFYINYPEKTILTYVAMGLTITFYVITTFISYYVYLMIVTVNLKLLHILKNSFIFAVLGFKSNIITFFFTTAIIAALALAYPLTLIPIILIGFTLIYFIIIFNSYQHIKKHVVDKYYESLETEDSVVEAQEEPEIIFSDEI